MVRNTTATVKSSSTKTRSTSTNEPTFDVSGLRDQARTGIKENRMTLAGLCLILLGLIQLWEQILGMIMLTGGILLISGFFSDKK